MRSRYKESDVNTPAQVDSLRDQRRSLAQAIEALRSPQRIYMPGVSHHLDDIDPEAAASVSESTKLWLPSSLPAADRDGWCTSDLPLIEFRLRYAQAVDSLDEIRRLRRLYRGLILQKKKHTTSTEGTKTRSQGVFEGLIARISRLAACYRDTRIALLRLHPNGLWKRYLLELKREDIQGHFEEDTKSRGVNFVPSWIWQHHAPSTPPGLPIAGDNTPDLGTSTSNPTQSSNLPDDVEDQEIEDYVRVDWAKAQERANRFEEEITLSIGDMRRTIAFFTWKVLEWERLAELRANSPNKPADEVMQGVRAYAYRTSNMYRDLIKAFVNDWYHCLYPKGLGHSWLAAYTDIIVPQKRWNKIPSIIPIPPLSGGIIPEGNSGAVSGQDDDGPGPSRERCSEDVEAELHDNFIDILAYS